MGVVPGALYRPLTAFTNGPMQSHRLNVLHVNDGTGNSLYNWIASNPNKPDNQQMSCHWQLGYDGRFEQYLPTELSSWCQSGGNMIGHSIETEGHPADPLNEAQLNNAAKICAYTYKTHGTALRVCNDINDPLGGLSYHGMGGAAWGGHTSCAGDLRNAQRAEIIRRAQAIVSPSSDPFMEEIMQYFKNKQDMLDQVALAVLTHGLGAIKFNGGMEKMLQTIRAEQEAQAKATQKILSDLGNLLVYGDGRNVTDESKNTHPYNLRSILNKVSALLTKETPAS